MRLRCLINMVCIPTLVVLQSWSAESRAAARFIPVDISRYCTHSFADQVGGDKKGGWVDQGAQNDLSAFPVGPQAFNGVPFDIVDPAKNGGKSCIVLNIEGFASRFVKGMEIGRSGILRIHFLHTSAYNRDIGDSGRYVINYRHGGAEYERRSEQVNKGYAGRDILTYPLEIPLVSPVNIADWWAPGTKLPQATWAWSGSNGVNTVGVVHFPWTNPDPTAVIESIDFHGPATNSVVPVLIAITLEEEDSAFLPGQLQQRDYYLTLRLIDSAKSRLTSLAEQLDGESKAVFSQKLKKSLSTLAGKVKADAKAHGDELDELGHRLAAKRESARTDRTITFDTMLQSVRKTDHQIKRIAAARQAERETIYDLGARDNKARALVLMQATRKLLPGRSGYWARTSRILLNAAQVYAAAPAASAYKRFLNAQNASYWAQQAKDRCEAASASDTVIADDTQNPISKANECTLPRNCLRTSICLNGNWEASRNGDRDRYPADGWTQISVPHANWTYGGATSWDDVRAWHGYEWTKEEEAKFPFFVWYRTRFSTPSVGSGRRVLVEFKKLWSYAEVFVNGKFCGNHYGGNTRFTVDVTGAIKPGPANHLAVYVEDDGLTRREDGGNFACATYMATNESRQIGIYDDVFLDIVPSTRITTPFVQTSFRNKSISVSFAVNRGGRAPVAYVAKAYVEGEGGFRKELGHKTVGHRASNASFTAKWADPVLWGPSKPWGQPGAMYKAIIELSIGGKPIDRVEVPFGFREFYAIGEKLYLNGREIFLQGDHIDVVTNGGFTLRNPEVAVHFMQLARGMNIDIVRTHCQLAPDWWWDISDELGMMFEPHNHICAGYWQVVPDRNWEDPALKVYMTRYLTGFVKEYRNHPSIVMWSPTNELMIGAHSAQFHEAVRFWQEMGKAMRSIDPTRLIHHQGINSLVGVKPYPLDMADLHYPLDQEMKEHSKLFPGVPTIAGEFADIGLIRSIYAAQDRATWEQCLREQYSYVENTVTKARKYGLAGAMPYVMTLGPAFISERPGSFWSNWPSDSYKVHWPSYSGVGVKIPYSTWPWQTDTVPMVNRTLFFDALRKLYDPRDPLKQEWPIQVVIEGAQPGENVYACLGDVACADGVKADGDGRALFLLRSAGDYTFLCGARSVKATLRHTPYVEKGGFSHIPSYRLN